MRTSSNAEVPPLSDMPLPLSDLASPPTPLTASAPSEKTKLARARVQFVDVLRLLALAQMVNGHTLDAIMVDGLREGPLFGIYDYLRGLVSVAFMTSAGLAYHLTTFKRFDPDKAARGRRKRVLRSFWLITLGYLLRASSGLWSSDPGVAERSLAYFLRVDVLHCIGFSILVLEIITALTKSAMGARLAAGLVGISVVALAPLGASLSVDAGNRVVTNWFSHDGGSYFPITPWAGYVLLGAALGGLVLEEAKPDATRWVERLGEVPRLFFVGLGLTLTGRLLGLLIPSLEQLTAGSRPQFFFEKLGLLLVLASGLSWITRRLTDRFGALPRPLVVLTGETLVMYVLHLQIIFFPHYGPARLFPHALELGPALLVALTVLVLTVTSGLVAPALRTRFFSVFERRSPPLTST